MSRHFHATKIKQYLWIMFRAVFLFSICFIILYPLLLRIAIAFQSPADVYDPTVVWIPRNFTLDNFRIAFGVMRYPESFFNSFRISILVALLQIAVCAISAYAFARLKFVGQNILFALVIFTIVVPPQTIIIPLYITFIDFWPLGGANLIGSMWPTLISTATGMGIRAGLFIYILRQYFKGMPMELEEAAMVDGAGVLRTFLRIILPNSIPMLLTVGLFAFVWQWNDSYFATLFMGDATLLSIRVLALGAELYHYALGERVRDPGVISLYVNAGVLLMIGPLIVKYVFVQRYFVEGIQRSGMVG